MLAGSGWHDEDLIVAGPHRADRDAVDVMMARLRACMTACRPGIPGGRIPPYPSQEVVMILLIVAAVFFVLWLLGFLAFHVTVFAIHLLLIAAVIALVAHFVGGRRSGRTRV
jgi:hypothetical protein